MGTAGRRCASVRVSLKDGNINSSEAEMNVILTHEASAKEICNNWADPHRQLISCKGKMLHDS